MRGADGDLDEIHGVGLLVIDGDFAQGRVIPLTKPLPKTAPRGLTATEDGLELLEDGLGLFGNLGLEIGARLRGIEAEFVHKVDVGLGAVALIVLVVDYLDPMETMGLLVFGLGSEDGLHFGYSLS